MSNGQPLENVVAHMQIKVFISMKIYIKLKRFHVGHTVKTFCTVYGCQQAAKLKSGYIGPNGGSAGLKHRAFGAV